MINTTCRSRKIDYSERLRLRSTTSPAATGPLPNANGLSVLRHQRRLDSLTRPRQLQRFPPIL
jgi:hypothetical protein